MNIHAFLENHLPKKFSFEEYFLEKNVVLSTSKKPKLYGLVQDEYFIDIGIPEDYEKAQIEFGPLNPPNGDLGSLQYLRGSN